MYVFFSSPASIFALLGLCARVGLCARTRVCIISYRVKVACRFAGGRVGRGTGGGALMLITPTTPDKPADESIAGMGALVAFIAEFCCLSVAPSCWRRRCLCAFRAISQFGLG